MERKRAEKEQLQLEMPEGNAPKEGGRTEGFRNGILLIDRAAIKIGELAAASNKRILLVMERKTAEKDTTINRNGTASVGRYQREMPRRQRW
jgi:hypothetical protein